MSRDGPGAGAAAGTSTVQGSGAWTIHKQLPQDHPFYATIGRVAAEFAQLEHVLDLIIWDMAAIDPAVGSCITGQMIGHGPRFNAILALGAHKGFDKSTLSYIDTLMQKVGNLAKHRNRIVHDAWYIEEGSGNVGQFKSFSVKEAKFGIQDIDAEIIGKLISDIQDRTGQINQLRSDLLDRLKASP